jgi:hypothetical protein
MLLMEAAVFLLKKTWGDMYFRFFSFKIDSKKSEAALTICAASIFCTLKLHSCVLASSRARVFCCGGRLNLRRFQLQSFLHFPLCNVGTYMQTQLKQKFLELVFETVSRVNVFVFCHNGNPNRTKKCG